MDISFSDPLDSNSSFCIENARVVTERSKDWWKLQILKKDAFTYCSNMKGNLIGFVLIPLIIVFNQISPFWQVYEHNVEVVTQGRPSNFLNMFLLAASSCWVAR